tara:strand:+ start:52 stop:624 length:573 start_codon:yes stop_codon:yes gene_type:complete
MATKKMSLNAWINSKLKDKGITASQAKKNAGKYKSIAAAKKAGSLYYTNKDGKVMIAAYAEDLKMPLKRPDSMKKKEIGKNIIKESFPAVNTSKITKKELSPPKTKNKTSSGKYTGLSSSSVSPSKKDLIISQINRIKSKTKNKSIGAGDLTSLNNALDKIKKTGTVTSVTQKLLDNIERRLTNRNKKKK